MFYQIRANDKKTMAHVTFTGLPRDDAEYDAFLKDLTDLYTPKQKFTMLFDTRGLGLLPLGYTVKLGGWIREHREDAREYLEKTAILIENPAIRVFLRALFLVSPPSSPLEIFDHLPGCVNYLNWKRDA